jgi:hypothetical protein
MVGIKNKETEGFEIYICTISNRYKQSMIDICNVKLKLIFLSKE